jgi:uncharacterized protein YcnI
VPSILTPEATVRTFTIIGLLAALLLLLALPAAAHVALNPAQLAPGDRLEAELVVTHGCDPAGGMPRDPDVQVPTVAVELRQTPGLTVTPLPVDGWTSSVDAETAAWVSDHAGGADGVVTLPVEVHATDGHDDGEVWLAVTQDCGDGITAEWDHTGSHASGGALPATRAMVVTEPSQRVPGAIIVGAVALAAAALVGTITYRRA